MIRYHHLEAMQWRNIDVFNRESVIVFALPVELRAKAGKMNQVSTPGKERNKHFSQACEGSALTLMRGMPLNRAGQISDQNNWRKWRISIDHVKVEHARLNIDNIVRV